MQNGTTGSKYEETKDLDIKDIAKLVRKDLAVRLPGFKFSVRIKRFAGGKSLDVEIVDCPVGVSFFRADSRQDLKDEIRKIVDSYNYDYSDVMTDYFNVRFYSDVQFSFQLLERLKT